MKRFLVVLLACCMVLGGCGGNTVPQEKYAEVVAERDKLQKDYDELLEKYSTEYAEGQVADLKNKVQEEIQEQSGAPQKDDLSEDASGEEAKKKDESKSNPVEVLAEYTLPDGINWYTRRFMIVKNNSDKTVDVSTSSLAYGADGKMVAAADSNLQALGSGCTSVCYEAFETSEAVDHYETDMKAPESKYYKSVIQDLAYTQNDVEGGAVFQVTNNGSEAAEFVEGYALFFMGDALVGFESTYFADDDSEIKPGATISQQITSYDEFDRIEFYLTGRR